MSGPMPKLGDPLSERELEVVRLVAEGLSNAAIAGRLFLSEHTVKSHVSRVLRKLGAADRTSAVLAGVRLGVLRADPPPLVDVVGVLELLIAVAEQVAAGPAGSVRREALVALTAAGRRSPGGRPLVPSREQVSP